MKTILIAGGSSGIGLAWVKKLTAKGNRVHVLSRTNISLAGLPNEAHTSKGAVAGLVKHHPTSRPSSKLQTTRLLKAPSLCPLVNPPSGPLW